MENSDVQKKKKGLILVISLLILILGGVGYLYFSNKDEKSKKVDSEKVDNTVFLSSPISSNSLDDFDLAFLKMENKNVNKIYSPLSIKYALAMLRDGVGGNTKEQIEKVIGNYNSSKYNNSQNLSLANVLFIKNSYKDAINSSYVSTLLNKYNAEVVYDDFKSPSAVNNWISNKTFNNINNLVDDVTNTDYILVNALALDMEWINKIQNETKDYNVNFSHRDYNKLVESLDISDYGLIDFEDVSKQVKVAEIGAVINKYDIIKTLGEENIRATVQKEYEIWLQEECEKGSYYCEGNPDYEFDLNEYMKEIAVGYNDISSSTDFRFYTDDNTKVFAKDLKTYDGTTLQYVGIMPIKEKLDEYIKHITSTDINTLINSLKTVELNNFKEGVITDISGYIPMFKFEYELSLLNDLGKLGVTDAFNKDKADLSGITSDNAYINDVRHKSNIEFSNDGIKASAAIEVGAAGNATSGFDYLYEVPIEYINLTFDKPYLFLIRNKDTNEVWFTGTVYNPIDDYVPTDGQS